MKLHQLASKKGKVDRKRRGQGRGTGNGTFAGRGCGGQNSRSGGGVRLGFEGGQTPLIQRMPKMKGFRNPNRVENQTISLEVLETNFKAGDTVSFETLNEKGLISNNAPVKILASGEVTLKLTVTADILTSGTAKAAIEKAGGKVEEAKEA